MKYLNKSCKYCDEQLTASPNKSKAERKIRDAKKQFCDRRCEADYKAQQRAIESARYDRATNYFIYGIKEARL